jgi:AraC family transcriptional regulator
VAPTAAAPVSLGADEAKQMPVPGFVASGLRFPPRLVLGPHAHGRMTLAVVLSGGFDGSWDGHAGACPPGTLLVEPAGEPHANRFGSRSASRVAIVQPDAELPNLLQPRARRASFRPEVVPLAGRLLEELRWPDAVTPLAVEGIALEIAAIAARQAAPGRQRPPWLRRAAAIIEDRCAQSVTLSGLADELDRHPAYLARAFRAAYGRSVCTYLREVRVRRAAELLGGGDAGIAEVALRVGFVDQSHLTRWFVRYLGVTPARYRTQVRDS